MLLLVFLLRYNTSKQAVRDLKKNDFDALDLKNYLSEASARNKLKKTILFTFQISKLCDVMRHLMIL